jgi:hypothetical protein
VIEPHSLGFGCYRACTAQEIGVTRCRVNGLTPGLVVVTGSVTALTAASAQTWGRGKEPATGYPDPPREKLGTTFYPMSGTSVKAYRFDFTYSARFPDLVR